MGKLIVPSGFINMCPLNVQWSYTFEALHRDPDLRFTHYSDVYVPLDYSLIPDGMFPVGTDIFCVDNETGEVVHEQSDNMTVKCIYSRKFLVDIPEPEMKDDVPHYPREQAAKIIVSVLNEAKNTGMKYIRSIIVRKMNVSTVERMAVAVRCA